MAVSNTTREAAFAQETADGILALITLTSADLPTPIRVVNDHQNVVSNGKTYVGFPFTLTPPGPMSDGPALGSLTISNVGLEISEAIRAARERVQVDISFVRLLAPDVVEQSIGFLQLVNVRADAGDVTGDLQIDMFYTEPYPAYRFVPSITKGIF